MAKTRSMTRNQNNDDASRRNRFKPCENRGASSMKRFRTCNKGGVVPWSELVHDVLFLVMMKLGIIDFVAFSGVCKSWRSFALCNKNKSMASKPPMSMWISIDGIDNKWYPYFYLEDFEGRSFKTILPHYDRGMCVGLTCGYLILFEGNCTRDFWLVNPITRHQLHFPDFPCIVNAYEFKGILVFSPSIPGWVFVVINRFGHKIWSSIAGKGSWNDVSSGFPICDLVAFKGKIYTLNRGGRLYEMSLNPNPKLSILEIENFGERHTYHQQFLSCGENLYVIKNYRHPHILYEINFGEMKRVSPEIGECAFFLSGWKHGVAIKSESWAVDPQSKYKGYDCFSDTSDETKKGRFFNANMWYFPHLCLDVDRIDE